MAKIKILPNLSEKLWSKFGRNYKSVIYGSVKFDGLGPGLVVTDGDPWLRDYEFESQH